VLSRWWALFCWCYLVWTLLSWTASVEQVVFGVVLAALVALACAPLGTVAGPWRLLAPRRLVAFARLLWLVVTRVVVADVKLTRLIWSRHPRPGSGMVVSATRARTDGQLTTVGVLTSVIVDSQLIDLDRYRHELQYHAVWVASIDPETNRRLINGPVEDQVMEMTS